NEELALREPRLRAVRTAAIDLAGAAIAEITPKPDQQLVKAFVQQVVSTLAKTALGELVPTRVADATSARGWLKDHLAGADTWKFHPSALETRPDTVFRTADAAMLALVARLEAQQAARRTSTFGERPFEARPFEAKPFEVR